MPTSMRMEIYIFRYLNIVADSYQPRFGAPLLCRDENILPHLDTKKLCAVP